MRIWNLSTLDELETPVVLTFKQQPTRLRTSESSRLRASIRVAAFAAAVSAGMVFHYPQVSAANLSVAPARVTAVAQSVPRVSPPLSDLFAGFSDDWSQQDEEAALSRMAATHSENNAAFSEAELVDMALGNQQESFATDIPRLTREQILKIARKRSA